MTQAAASPYSAARPAALSLRRERDTDAAFRFALFRQSRPPGGDLAGLAAGLRDLLLGQLFAGQTASYRTLHPEARFDIVECDGEPVGRIVVDRADDHIVIVDVALLPERRGRGLGSRILRTVLDEATAAGVSICLSVQATNGGALRLYRRLGFVPVEASETAIALEWTPAR